MGSLLCFICIALASFAILVQPAIAQGSNTLTYPGHILQADGSQTCHSKGQRERVRNGVDSAMLSLLWESVVPLLQNFSCGGSFGWRRVAYLDMSDTSQRCPSAWREVTIPHRVCGRKLHSSGPSCDGVTYSTGSVQYDQVCGRVIGYQFGHAGVFNGGRTQSINTYYVYGISVTRGYPRQHIWTFAAGYNEQISTSSCPCITGNSAARNRVPSFVGQNYFCETGFNGDPLWDGQGCGPTSSCCTFHSPPWFNVQLPSPTTDNIEVRICSILGYRYTDTPIQLIELYVK